MKTITVPEPHTLDAESQSILEKVQKKMGRVPNLYATIGYAPSALKSMLETDNALSHGSSFSAKEREAVNLIVSQVNACNYCLAAHIQLAEMRGFSQPETIQIRQAAYPSEKLNAVILLSKSIAENKGVADPALLESFFAQGYEEKALIELIALISLRTFTNYVFANTNIPIDFPEAQALS